MACKRLPEPRRAAGSGRGARAVGLLAIWLFATAAAADTAARPNPELSPTAVIAAQLAAFRQYSSDDAGIARAFRFASPANREQTGPLSRFTRMIKNSFAIMLDHQRHEFAPLMVNGDQAGQLVTLIRADGSRAAYFFQLSRGHSRGDCQRCWLVDAVQPVPADSVPELDDRSI